MSASTNRKFRRCAAALFILGATLVVGAGVIAAPPTVQDVVNEFSVANYRDVLTNKLYTHLGMNRSSDYGRQHDLCRDSISNEFYRVGFAPQFDAYTYLSPYGTTIHGWNVVAVLPGALNPSNEIYVVSGHYDSVDNPGADDDASGVAGVLELARVFRQHRFAKTMVFCAFDSEELETWPGSSHYVSLHLADNIKGMVSMDMIARQASGSFSNMAYLEGGLESVPWRNDLKTAIETYGGGLTATINAPPGDTSDHVSFANAGFPACAFAEADWHNNPNFHQLTDAAETPGNLDWVYAGKMCRSAIGFFAGKLQLLDVSPQILAIVRNTNASVSVHFIGLPGSKYATDYKADLSGTVWTALETNTAATDGSFTTNDPLPPGQASRFYRARFVPPD